MDFSILRLKLRMKNSHLKFFLIDRPILIILESAEAEIFHHGLEKVRRMRGGHRLQIIMSEVKK
jgi:hypothetical protein